VLPDGSSRNFPARAELQHADTPRGADHEEIMAAVANAPERLIGACVPIRARLAHQIAKQERP
jgi:hypothetical protein